MPHEPVDHRASQRLLELAYGLLADDEAEALRARIAAEPTWEAAYAEAQRQAALLGHAARLQAPNVEYLPSRRGRSAEGNGSRRSATNRWQRGAQWAIGFAATLLLLMSAVAYLLQRQQLADLAAEHLRLVIAGPAQLHAGATSYYSVSTSTVDGTPLPTQVEFIVSAADAPDGKPLLRQKEQSDRNGQLQLAIPSDMLAPAGLSVEFQATHQNRMQRVTAHLPAVPGQYRTQVTLDRARYEPGEVLWPRSLTLSRFGMVVEREVAIEYALCDAQGAPTACPPIAGTTRRGVGAGRIELPAELPPGSYRLVARSPDRLFPPTSAALEVVPYGTRPASTAAASGDESKPDAAGRQPIAGREKPAVKPLTPWTSRVQFFPEGGTLVAGLQNRVYLQAQDAAGAPVALQGRLLDDEGRELATVETSARGLGRLRFTPASGRRYRLQVTQPAGAVDEPALPEVSSTTPLALHADAGVFAASSPVTLELLSARADLPVVVAATCRGIPVGQKLIQTKAGSNEVVLPLSSGVGGIVAVTAYAFEPSGPRPLAGRLVYRRPERRLRVHVPAHDNPHTPGDKVAVVATVTNERGESVPAVLGVSVVRRDLLPAGAESDEFAARFWRGDELADVALTEEDTQALLTASPQSDLALDLLLGARPWPGAPAPGPAAGAAPAVFDNLADLHAQYQESLDAYRSRRSRFVDTLATLGFFGGFGLLLLVTLLALLRMTAGVVSWIPAVSAALCCVALGAVLLNPSRLNASLGEMRGFTSHLFKGTASAVVTSEDPAAAAPAAIPAGEPGAGLTLGKPTPPAPSSAATASGPAKTAADGNESGSAFTLNGYTHVAALAGSHAAPPVLLWNPSLVVGSDGRARVEFALPDAPGNYLVRVEASAEGRLGLATDRVVAQVPFTITPQIPGELTASDLAQAVVDIVSGASAAQALDVQWKLAPLFKPTAKRPVSLDLAAGARRQETILLEAVGLGGTGEVAVTASNGGYEQSHRRSVTVVPTGYPYQRAWSGRLGESATLSLDLPDDVVPGSLAGELVLFPSLASELAAGLEALEREPAHNAERLASRLGLLGLAITELADSGLGDALEARRRAAEARDVLRDLEAYRAPGGGFSRVPGGEPDLALTAWVTLQLPALTKAGVVPPQRMADAAAWLAKAARSAPPTPADDDAGQDLIPTLATWGLFAAGHPAADAQTERLARQAADADDPYFVALAALVVPAPRSSELAKLLKKLQAAQDEDGHVPGHRATITGGRGAELSVQTTALAILAWNRSSAHRAAASRALDWLLMQRGADGGFGSSQATNLALRAIAALAGRTAGRSGALECTVRLGKQSIDTQALPGGQRDPVVLQQWATHLEPGENKLSLEFKHDGDMPYLLRLAYHRQTREPSPAAGLALAVQLGTAAVRRGQAVELTAELTNGQKQPQSMVVAVLGLPAGLEIAPPQLAALVKRGVIDAFDVRGRQLIVSWRSIPPQKKIVLKLTAQARWAGRYTGPVSHAYLEYARPVECWAPPLTVQVLEAVP